MLFAVRSRRLPPVCIISLNELMNSTLFYSTSDRGTEYCDVCLLVCVFVRDHIVDYTGWLKIKYPTGEYAISLQPMVYF